MMGLQAIEAAPKNGNPVFLADQDAGDITAAHRTVRQGACPGCEDARAVCTGAGRRIEDARERIETLK
jgi:hypothetical protein